MAQNSRIQIEILGTLSADTQKKIKTQLDTVAQGVGKSNATKNMKELNNQTKLFSQNLGSVVAKFGEWLIVGNLIMGTLRRLRSSIDFLVSLDEQMTVIAMVTNQTREQVSGLVDEYVALADALKVSSLEIATSAVALYRQGLNAQEVEERLIAISKAAKTAGIETTQATEYVTAGVNAMGVSAEHFNDVLLKVGSVAGTSYQELGEAFQKSASSFATANIELEKSASYIATVSEVTRQSASTIGASMKTIIARFSKVTQEGADNSEVLNSIQKALEKVNIAFTDSNGQMRDVDDILDDLAGKWESLDKNTQNYLRTEIAGVRQGNNFIALMDNYSRSLEIYNEALDAAGTQNEQYQKYLDSTAAAVESITIAWEKFAVAMTDADVIKDVANMLSGLINGLTAVTDGIGFFNTILLISGAIIGSKYIPQIAVAIGKLFGYKLAVAEATLATKAFNAMLGFGLVGALIGAVAIIDGLTTSTKELENDVATLTSEYESLNDELDKLAERDDLTQAEQERLELLELQVAAQKTLLDLKKQELALRTTGGSNWQEFANAFKALANEDFYKSFSGEEFGATFRARSTTGASQLANYVDAISKLNASISDIESQTQGLDPIKDAEKIAEITSQLAERRILLSQVEAEAVLVVGEQTEAYKLLEAQGIAVDEGVQSNIDWINNYIDTTDNAVKATQEEEQALVALPPTLEELRTEYSAITDKIEILSDLEDHLSETNGTLSESVDYLVDNYDDLVSAGIDVQDVLEGQITLERALERATFEANIGKAKSYYELGKITSDFMNVSATNWNQYFKAMTDLYGSDIENWKTLAELKADIDALLIRTLGANWNSYYNSQSDALQALLSAAQQEGRVSDIIYYSKQIAALKEATDVFSTAQFDIADSFDEVSGSASSASESVQTFIDLLKEQLEIQKDIYDAQKEAAQAELDALKQQYKEEDRLLELKEKELEVEKAQLELNNTLKEQNVRLLTDTGWEWVADPGAVRDAQEALADAENDLADINREQSRERAEEALQQQIDNFDAQSNAISEFISDMGMLNDEVANNVNSWQQLISALNQAGIEYQDILSGGIIPSSSTQISGGGTSGTGAVGLVSSIAGTLKKGSKGNDVKTLQTALNALGYSVGNVDGIFGDKTASAVQAFQNAQGIASDGIVGTNTKNKFKLLGYKQDGLVDKTGVIMGHGTTADPGYMLNSDITKFLMNAVSAMGLREQVTGYSPSLGQNTTTTNDRSLTIDKLIVHSSANNFKAFIEDIKLNIPNHI